MTNVEFTRIDSDLVDLACTVIELLQARGLALVTAESCTGGLVAAVLSEAPGAGRALHGGFVTYTKAQKTAALGVPAALLDRHGAVSEPVARAMAEGALARSPADIAVAVTGVAGPQPDEDGTPVGVMHFAAARRGKPTLHRMRQFGDVGRGPCRSAAVREVFDLVREAAEVGDPQITC
jgi:nicotinamide-nucleotide amidase